MTGELKPYTKQFGDAHIFTTTGDLYVITILPSFLAAGKLGSIDSNKT